MRILCALVGLSVAFPVIADDTEKELKKMAGTWETVSQTRDGTESGADEIKGLTVVIDAAGKWEAFKDGTSILKGTVKIDPSKKPKSADWSVEGTDIVAKGIFEVDGDNFKHCFSLKDRPTEFASKAGSEVTYAVLKRVKK
jgi:uncharacterized protein (TIGR03067 family)